MNESQRQAVVENAKYLRNVRPIDPEEIYEYVDGNPHPAAIRHVLREHAFSLGLVETDAGTFTPVPDEPIPSRDTEVKEFPKARARRFEELLVDAYGPDWSTGDTGARLREAIRRLKAEYYHGTDVSYGFDDAYAYGIYHLPDYYAAIQYVLDDLTDRGLLDRQLRVLDIGAGPGGPAFGLIDYLTTDAVLEYHAIEPSPAADILEALLIDSPRNVHWTIHRTRAEAYEPPPADLVVFANVLSELTNPRDTVNRYAEALNATGSLVLIAPADKETSTNLRVIERDVTNGLGVYSPTIRLWRGHEPRDRCWSFDVHPDLAVPDFQRRLDNASGASGELVNVDVQYSYAILRRDGSRRIEFVPDKNRYAPLATTGEHVTNRIDVVAVKLSHDLSDGDNAVFLIGDGSQHVDHYAVLTRPTSLNRSLLTADYGDLLILERALVLWNDDESAYNLVVDDETVVDRIAP